METIIPIAYLTVCAGLFWLSYRIERKHTRRGKR